MSGSRSLARVTLRFVVTGVAATATYLALTVLLMARPLGLEPVVASAVASLVSILVSYAGHHRYTFERRGRHDFYFPRFAAVTAALFALSTAAMYVFTRVVPADPDVVATAIALAYPPASYLLNLLWVFRVR